MVDLPPPSMRLSVNTDALAANWRTLDRLSGTATAGAAVKANAYGLGVDICVPALREAGARDFFVAHWSEVADVARHVDSEAIAVLHGIGSPQEAAYARAVGAIPVINSIEQAELWSESGGGLCHLMLDSGIHRLGIAPEEIEHLAIRALEIDIFMSHLSSADEDSSRNRTQRDIFARAAEVVGAKRRSLANGAGIMLGADYHFDVTRPGLALYGGVPRTDMAGLIEPVAHIQTRIMQVKTVRAGAGVGYNATFIADTDMRVGIVSIGYADGFLRSRGPGTVFLHEGRELPLLGKVSMDMVVIDLGNAPDLCAGAWLDIPFDLPAAAQQSGLSQYELLTTLGRRLHG